MGYKINCEFLYSGDIFSDDILKVVARNRSLPENWCTRSFDFCDLTPVTALKNIAEARDLLVRHIRNGSKIQIVVDCDVDGYCSAAIVYKLCWEIAAVEGTHLNIDGKGLIGTTFSIHSGKQHGLSADIKIDKDTNLVIIPDAGSNDVLKCLELSQQGIDVLILDHHIMDVENPYATIVNCMDGIYPNEICGTAVSWQFARAVNYKYGKSINIDEWLDLVAVATVADSMNVTIEENMFYVYNGLKNIRSNIIKEFLVAGEVPVNDVSIEDVKFKISPNINAMIRMGSMEEKTLLLRAFIDDFEVFDYAKRGSFEITKETIYTRAVRFCKNAKSRQDRAKEKCIESFKKTPSLLIETPYIVIANCADANPSITGLVANELASSKRKPCICLRPSDDLGINFSAGSMRNYADSPIDNLKSVLMSTCLFEFVQGHDNSAGVGIYDYDIQKIPSVFESVLFDDIKANIGSKSNKVDFALSLDNVDLPLCKSMSVFDKYTGYGFPEVTVFIADIPVNNDNFAVMGKNSKAWKVKINDDVSIVKFKLSENDELLSAMDDVDFESVETKLSMDIVCTLRLNNYNGVISAQCIVKDYELHRYICTDGDDIWWDGLFEDDIDFGI